MNLLLTGRGEVFEVNLHLTGRAAVCSQSQREPPVGAPEEMPDSRPSAYTRLHTRVCRNPFLMMKVQGQELKRTLIGR